MTFCLSYEACGDMELSDRCCVGRPEVTAGPGQAKASTCLPLITRVFKAFLYSPR